MPSATRAIVLASLAVELLGVPGVLVCRLVPLTVSACLALAVGRPVLAQGGNIDRSLQDSLRAGGARQQVNLPTEGNIVWGDLFGENIARGNALDNIIWGDRWEGLPDRHHTRKSLVLTCGAGLRTRAARGIVAQVSGPACERD